MLLLQIGQRQRFPSCAAWRPSWQGGRIWEGRGRCLVCLKVLMFPGNPTFPASVLSDLCPQLLFLEASLFPSAWLPSSPKISASLLLLTWPSLSAQSMAPWPPRSEWLSGNPHPGLGPHPARTGGRTAFPGRKEMPQTDLETADLNFSPPAPLKWDEFNFQPPAAALGRSMDGWISEGRVCLQEVPGCFASSILDFSITAVPLAPPPGPSPTRSLGQLLSIAGNICWGGQARPGVTAGRWPVPSPRSCNLRHV